MTMMVGSNNQSRTHRSPCYQVLLYFDTKVPRTTYVPLKDTHRVGLYDVQVFTTFGFSGEWGPKLDLDRLEYRRFAGAQRMVYEDARRRPCSSLLPQTQSCKCLRR